MGWIQPVIAGAGIAINALSRPKGRSRHGVRNAIAELRAQRPTGYLTDEDRRAAELTKGRLTEGAQRQGQLAGYELQRRTAQRGLAGSPSDERARARVGEQTALGVQHAGESAEELLYNTQRSREAYQHQGDLAIFGAQVGEAQREQERQQAEQGAFWNSLNEYIPTIINALGPNTAMAPGTGSIAPDGRIPVPRGYDPSAPPEYPRT